MLNAMAEGLSDVHQFLKHARKNFYVSTADTLVRTHAYRCEIPQGIHSRNDSYRNLLRNAGFRDLGAAFWNHPLEWQVTSGEFTQSDSYAGNGSVNLSPNGSIYQIVSGERYRQGERYTCSVWMKSSDTGEEDNGNLTLTAAGWGWTQEASLDFALGTTGEWVQQFVGLTTTGEMRTLKLSFTSTPTGEVDVLVCAPIMQLGDSLQNWAPGLDQTIQQEFRLYMVGSTGETQSRIELSQVVEEYAFFEDAIPTRLESSPGITGDLLSDNFAPPTYEWSKDYWECEFRVSGDYIERYSVRIPSDVWNEYSVLDRYMDNEVNTGEYGFFTGEYDGFTRTLEALCVWRGRIYLIAKESYGGSTHRVLKIVRWQGVDNRLETIHDLRLGMDTGDVSSVGFVEGRMDQLGIVMSDDATWTVQMYFDQYLYDSQRRQVLTRHPYTGYTLTFGEV